MKTIHKLTTIFLFSFLLVAGCAQNCTTQKTSSAEQMMLKELDHCGSKHGTTLYNVQYCDQLLTTIDSLIRDGYFNIQPNELKERYNVTAYNDMTTKEEEIKKEVETMKFDIIGDI